MLSAEVDRVEQPIARDSPSTAPGHEARVDRAALTVFMPCHNEVDRVERTLAATVATLQRECDREFEIILVDDGSVDGTERVAESVAASLSGIRVLRFPRNGGKGSALRKAFAHASGGIVCFLDGDGDVSPSNLMPLVRALEADHCQVVVGSKRHPKSDVDYPLERRFLSTGYQLLVQFLFHINIRDTQAGIKVFKREVLESVLPLGLVKRYAFDAELLVLAHRMGYRIAEMPIELRYRRKEVDGVNVRAIGQMLLDTLGVFYRLHITKYYRV